MIAVTSDHGEHLGDHGEFLGLMPDWSLKAEVALLVTCCASTVDDVNLRADSTAGV